jgi:plasmid maintenance system antidote protein VapI
MEQSDEVVDQVVTNQMLDKIIAFLHLKNDAALARALETPAPLISKLRHGRLGLTANMIVKIHEVTGWPPRNIKAELNLPCLSQKVMTAQ